MKNYYRWLLLLLLQTGAVYAQTPAPDVQFDRSYYDRYVVREIRYTVLNRNSNVPGLTVNIGKNEITGTASLKGDDPIQTIEFSIASNSDGVFSLFSNGSFDSKFRIGYNYNLIPYWSHSDVSGSAYEQKIARTQYEQKKRTILSLRDSVVVMVALLKSADRQFDFQREFNKSQKPDLDNIDVIATNWLTRHSKNKSSQSLLKAITDKYQPDPAKPVDVPKLYQALETKIDTLEEQDNRLADAQIQYFGPFHTAASRYWFTFSPSFEISPVKAYNAQYKLEDFYGAKATIRAQFNILNRNSRKYALWRIGLQAGLTNNVTQLSKELYAYTKTTTIVKNDSVSVIQQDKADAYSRAAIRNGFGANLIIEYFNVPASAGFLPGLYFSLSPGFNTAYRTNEQAELPVEIGAVFSLLSNESKAIYLLPYVSFTNLTRFNPDNRFFKRDWLVGLKFGLPFGLQANK